MKTMQSRRQEHLIPIKRDGSVPPDSIPAIIRKHLKIPNKTGQLIASGTYGNAIRFGSKVLKVTTDPKEALACMKIVGKKLRHVYRIYGVAGKKAKKVKDGVVYFIWQEYLDEPTFWQQIATQAFYEASHIHYPKTIVKVVNLGLELAYEIMPIPEEDEMEDAVGSFLRLRHITAASEMVYAIPYIGTTFWDALSHQDVDLKDPFTKFLEAMKQVGRAHFELLDQGILFFDYHIFNVRRRGNDLVIIDLGVSQVSSPVHIEVFDGLFNRRW